MNSFVLKILIIIAVMISILLISASPTYAWDQKSQKRNTQTNQQPSTDWRNTQGTQVRNGDMNAVLQKYQQQQQAAKQQQWRAQNPQISQIQSQLTQSSVNPQNRIHVSRSDPNPHLRVQEQVQAGTRTQVRTAHVPYRGQTTVDMYTRGGSSRGRTESRIQQNPRTFSNSGIQWQQMRMRR